MRPARIYRTEAIIIKRFDYGEADKILTLYTPHHGKLSAIAKGIRRPKSRMGGHLDLFTHSLLLIAHGRNLDIVTQAQSLESFGAVRSDLWRSSYAHYVAELVDAFAPDRLPNVGIYRAAVMALRRLSTLTQPLWAVRAFEMRVLGLAGYQPQLHNCLVCGDAIVPQVNRFSVTMGGTLCPDCGHADAAAPTISVPALKAMRNLQTNEERVLGVQSMHETTLREIERRMQEYIEYRLERRPKSIRFLDTLRMSTAVKADQGAGI